MFEFSNEFKKRLKNAERIAKNLKKMEKHGYYILLRPQQEIGGVIFKVDKEYHSDTDRMQQVAYMYDVKNGIWVKEPLEVWDSIDEDFVNAIQAKFGCILLTSLTSHIPGSKRVYWIPPADAEHYRRMFDEAKGKLQSLHELSERNKTLEDELEKLRVELDMERKRYFDLKREHGIIADRLAKTEGLYRAERARIISAMTTLKELESYLNIQFQKAKERGEEIAMDAIEKTQKDIDRIISMLHEMRGFVETFKEEEKKEEQPATGVSKEVELPEE